MTQTDSPQPLYAAREPVFPRNVRGKFRTLKWWIMGITLGIYYLTPWLRWDRGPQLPDQAVLVDLANRRFYFLWIEIWPHEFYFIAGLLIMAGLGLFLFTSALGRVWCGYACPQTVWTDLFILTERWIEGDRNARIRLWNAPWDGRKVRLRLLKWVVWVGIGLATGGAWVFYFADAPTLARDLFTGQGHPVAYVTIAVLTLTTVLFGGFAREQICIYMCPWPRIQSAMIDEDTLTIAYREWRGEPRGRDNVRRRGAAETAGAARAGIETQAGGPLAGRKYPSTPMPGMPSGVGGPIQPGAVGDCIDCMACVNVCPMGIDIRNGQQLECITCGLCIDACDDVMEKIGKPRGLIDYLALKDEERERAGMAPTPVLRHVLRPRTLLYTSLWTIVGVGLVFLLFIRPEIDMTVAPVRNPTFVMLSDGAIRNTYDIRLRNKNGEDRTFRLSMTAPDGMRLELEGVEGHDVPVGADALKPQRVYVVAPPDSAAATGDRTDLRLWVEDLASGERASVDTIFNGKTQ